MKNAKRLMVLALALALCLTALVMPTASADTGIKAKFGAFAAETSDKLFMILPGEGVSSLYSMPAAGGYLTLIETASQISDLVADASGNVYYLRYTGASFQAIMRKTEAVLPGEQPPDGDRPDRPQRHPALRAGHDRLHHRRRHRVL